MSAVEEVLAKLAAERDPEKSALYRRIEELRRELAGARATIRAQRDARRLKGPVLRCPHCRRRIDSPPDARRAP